MNAKFILIPYLIMYPEKRNFTDHKGMATISARHKHSVLSLLRLRGYCIARGYYRSWLGARGLFRGVEWEVLATALLRSALPEITLGLHTKGKCSI